MDRPPEMQHGQEELEIKAFQRQRRALEKRDLVEANSGGAIFFFLVFLFKIISSRGWDALEGARQGLVVSALS